MSSRALASSSGGAIEFLTRRMQHSQDFPALSETIRTLNQLSSSSEKSNDLLADIIVRDYALTNKILKVVNSAFYAGFAGKVGTISRAIVVLGLEPIRLLAASLLLFEQFAANNKADKVKALIGKSMFGALLAREAADEAGLQNQEEAFLAAMFHNLGELLVAYYLPEEDAAIEEAMARGGATADQIQKKLLGVSCEQLGVAIGEHWSLPATITHSMKRVREGEHAQPDSVEERLRRIAAFANDLTERLAEGTRADDETLVELAKRYSGTIDYDQAGLREVVSKARAEYRVLADSLTASKNTSPALQALAGEGRPGAASPGSGEDLSGVSLPEDQGEDPGTAVDPGTVLLEGLQEATGILAAGADLHQIAQVVLETLYRAFSLRRVALCLRDVSRRQYVGRLGFGDDIDDYLKALRFGEAYERDVFHVALAKKTDVHIEDLGVAAGGHGIPDWFSAMSPKGALLFLPVIVQDRPVGCVIAEHARDHGLQINPATLRLVRALRNQLALAVQLRSQARA